MKRIGVAIMAKMPQAGAVKTRLCPPLTHEEAAQLYRCFLLDKIIQVRTLGAAMPTIAYSPPETRPFFQTVAPDFALVPQRGEDLGARLTNCFAQLFDARCIGVLAVDSDTPTLPTDYLRQAMDLIVDGTCDVVLGPTEDGGYYLIGLRELHGELFEDMAWSTPRVLLETIQRAEARGLKVRCLPSWFDVDTPAEIVRLRDALARTEGTVAPNTRRFLGEHAP